MVTDTINMVILPGWRMRVQVMKEGGDWKDMMDIGIPSGNDLVETEDGDIVEGDEARTHGHLFSYTLGLYEYKIPEESRGGSFATPALEDKNNG